MTSSVEDYLASQALRAQDGKRECPICPEWVLMCAHLNGTMVTLQDVDACKRLHEADCATQRYRSPFTVATGGELGPPWCGCNLLNYHSAQSLEKFSSLDEAIAAFRRREAELLGRS